MTAPVAELPAARVMRKYIVLLQRVSSLELAGFAHVLDTADPLELGQLEQAADLLNQQIERASR